MKVYLIYLNITKVQHTKSFLYTELAIDQTVNKPIIVNGDKYALFAYTNDKMLLTQFLHFRNRDVFITKKVSMCKEEYKHLITMLSDNQLIEASYCMNNNRMIKLPVLRIEDSSYDEMLGTADDIYEDLTEMITSLDVIWRVLSPEVKKITKKTGILNQMEDVMKISIGEPVSITINIIWFLLDMSGYTF